MGKCLGMPVNITMLVHPVHTNDEPCQGTAIVSSMHPAEILTSIMYAGTSVNRLLMDMATGPKPTLN